MSDHEVTNYEWQTFYKAMLLKHGKEKAAQYLPDGMVWEMATARETLW